MSNPAVYIRGPIGNSGMDRRIDVNWTESGQHGFRRGMYGLWLPWLSPITQAQHFVTTYQQYQWELPPAGDFELVPPDETNQASAILTYLQAIEEGLGIKPMIYTGKPWWNRWVGDVEWASDYKLWLAAYYSPEATIHPPERFWPGDLPLGWDGNFPSGMWQFSSTMPGREWGVSSTNLDMNWRVV